VLSHRHGQGWVLNTEDQVSDLLGRTHLLAPHHGGTPKNVAAAKGEFGDLRDCVCGVAEFGDPLPKGEFGDRLPDMRHCVLKFAQISVECQQGFPKTVHGRRVFWEVEHSTEI